MASRLQVRPPSRRAGVIAAVLVAVVLAAAVLARCSHGSDDKTAATPRTGTPSLATPTRSFTAPPTPTTSVRPSVAVSTLKPVAIGTPVTVTGDVQVSLKDLRRITVTANGPGETSGPAVSFVVEVRNDSAEQVDLGGFAVTATYGKSTPAIPSGAEPSKPLSGALTAGKSASGTYVFRVPKTGSKTITVQVASNAASGIAVFRS